MSKDEDSAISISEVVSKIKEQVALSSSDTSEPYIPDIIEFCYSKKYLNMKAIGKVGVRPINLFPMQQIILKSFYRGQSGNEHIKLTPEEIEMLFTNKMQLVLDKYHSNALFRELVLVLGRRSGKDFMTSMIALYECMKLLECPSGSPFGYYGLAPGNPIYIITVATSADQARILYNEIKSRMQGSEYFKSKIGKVEADRLWFLTPEDKKNNADLVKQGLPTAQTPGSICIMSGHSNSEGLLGKRIYCLLLDEVASFKTTGGATSGDRIYSALTPATADFKHPTKTYKDENGEDVPLLDSKIISISSPRGEEGMLFHLYNTAPKNHNRLAYQLPTWKVNQMFSEISLRSEFKFMNPNEFLMEFGAEFSGTAGEKFIPDIYIEEAVEMGRRLNSGAHIQGIPGVVYFAHLDPAATSHNYALTVLHVEERIRTNQSEIGPPKKEKFKLFVVDHVKVWHPYPDRSISVHEVDEYVIDLAKRFRFALVTYDSWNSMASIQKLRSKGIPTRMTPFRKQYKIQIYNHLEHLLVNHQLALPYKGHDAELMAMELKCLKRVYGPLGFKIQPDDDALATTDDCCDSLAGACGVAMEQHYAGYAKGGVVNMPQSRDAAVGGQSWNIGRGQYAPQQWQFLNRKFGKIG
jgi:hypothetical protein